MSCHPTLPRSSNKKAPEDIVVGSPLSCAAVLSVFFEGVHCTLWTTPDTIRDNEKCTVMQWSSTKGLGFLVFRDMTKSIGNAPISLLHFATHILFVAAPLHETNQYHLTQHHPTKKTQNTSLKVSPQQPPQQKPRHKPPKTTGSMQPPPGKQIGRIRRLDLWNAGRGARGTLVGPGMEAIMDPPPRYGSSVAWLG